MITKDAIESAYSFFHQKQRIYQYSTLSWQKDDIEMAIADYTSCMSPELYALLSGGNSEYLQSHTTFATHLLDAVNKLEKIL